MSSSSSSSSSVFLSFGSLIIDDIVHPDGTTKMAVLGGGGVHASFGMRMWTRDVCYPARLGIDCPDACRQQLVASGINLSGMCEVHVPAHDCEYKPNHQVSPDTLLALPTPRAWNVFEYDGRRSYLLRTSDADYRKHFRLTPSLNNLPSSVIGIHLLCAMDRMDEMMNGIDKIYPMCKAIVWEPSPNAFIPASIPGFCRVLPRITLFSPNLEETVRLFGGDVPPTSIRLMCHLYRAMGARDIILRMGEAGCVVYTMKNELFHIPVYPNCRVVDVTGAGNSFCGGLLVTYVQHEGDVIHAAMCATVSGSWTVESHGLPSLPSDILTLMQQRFKQVESAFHAIDQSHVFPWGVNESYDTVTHLLHKYINLTTNTIPCTCTCQCPYCATAPNHKPTKPITIYAADTGIVPSTAATSASSSTSPSTS